MDFDQFTGMTVNNKYTHLTLSVGRCLMALPTQRGYITPVD